MRVFVWQEGRESTHTYLLFLFDIFVIPIVSDAFGMCDRHPAKARLPDWKQVEAEEKTYEAEVLRKLCL